jgi:hypothetical protein
MVHELQCGINADTPGKDAHSPPAVRSFALAALLPPANVERELTRLQQTLFADHSVASAFALPPVLPIAALAPDSDPGRFARAVEPLRQAFHLEAGAAAVHGVSVLVEASIDTEGRARLDAIARAVADPQAEPPPFPLLRGFWIAEFPSIAALPSRLPDHAAPGFSSFHYGLMVVRYLPVEGRWWERVAWEIRARVSTRRSPTRRRARSGPNPSPSSR